MHLLNKNVNLSIKSLVKFLPMGLIDNNTTLHLKMTWPRPDDKPLSETIRLLAHICVTRSQWVNKHLNSIESCYVHYITTLVQRGCRERFPRHRLQRKPLVSDLDMHHGTCVISGSLTRRGGENVPGFPAQFCVFGKGLMTLQSRSDTFP